MDMVQRLGRGSAERGTQGPPRRWQPTRPTKRSGRSGDAVESKVLALLSLLAEVASLHSRSCEADPARQQCHCSPAVLSKGNNNVSVLYGCAVRVRNEGLKERERGAACPM